MCVSSNESERVTPVINSKHNARITFEWESVSNSILIYLYVNKSSNALQFMNGKLPSDFGQNYLWIEWEPKNVSSSSSSSLTSHCCQPANRNRLNELQAFSLSVSFVVCYKWAILATHRPVYVVGTYDTPVHVRGHSEQWRQWQLTTLWVCVCMLSAQSSEWPCYCAVRGMARHTHYTHTHTPYTRQISHCYVKKYDVHLGLFVSQASLPTEKNGLNVVFGLNVSIWSTSRSFLASR